MSLLHCRCNCWSEGCQSILFIYTPCFQRRHLGSCQGYEWPSVKVLLKSEPLFPRSGRGRWHDLTPDCMIVSPSFYSTEGGRPLPALLSDSRRHRIPSTELRIHHQIFCGSIGFFYIVECNLEVLLLLARLLLHPYIYTHKSCNLSIGFQLFFGDHMLGVVLTRHSGHQL